MYANTTNRNPTHFTQAINLIELARKNFNIPSENWPHPTQYRLGTPGVDPYYAEIWTDGMDWQHSYWLIESIHWNPPMISPIAVFDDHGEIFECANELFEAILQRRRDKEWIKSSEWYPYNDSVWPFLRPVGEHEKQMNLFSTIDTDNQPRRPNEFMDRYFMEHASQPRYEFWLNASLIF